MFKKFSCLLALCLCLIDVQGCRRTSDTGPDITLAHEVSPQPPRVGPVKITLRATDSSGKPVTKARIALQGHMTHAGMTPVSGGVTELEPGHYVSVLDLPMAGDWIVVVSLAVPGQRILQREFEIKGVLPAQ